VALRVRGPHNTGPPASAAYAAFDPTGPLGGQRRRAGVLNSNRAEPGNGVTGRFGGPER